MIEVTAPGVEKENLEKVVDGDIDKFDVWFQKTVGAEPIVRSERAILKAYLWYKIRGEKDAPNQTGAVEAGNGA